MASTQPIHKCHSCGFEGLRSFEKAGNLLAVTSDCRSWEDKFLVGVCPQCGLVQKVVDESWSKSTKRIYSSYDLYHQSADRSEQLIFDQDIGVALPRSEVMFRNFFRKFKIPESGRFLDLGCGTGPTLKAFSAQVNNWSLFGFDPHLPDRERVLKIPNVCDVYEGELTDIENTFDLITAVHVLEHVTNPLSFLRGMRDRMHENSLAILQVPHFPDSPFDISIFDHCSHFSKQSIEILLARAGLQIEYLDTQLLPKEISIVARRTEVVIQRNQDNNLLSQQSAIVEASIAWLSALQEQALTTKTDVLGVFGTSIGANWLYGILHDRIAFFVDEDPLRYGREYRGRYVYSPKDIPQGSKVLMPLPRDIACQIRERLNPHQCEFILPPEDALNN